MFNFTTQTVYNSITVATDQQVKSGAVRNANLISSTGSKKPALRIGNTRFDADDILDIQVKKPTAEALAEVTFSVDPLLDKVTSEGTDITARIVLYIGLSMNAQDAFYANPFLYKGKPLTIEFPVKTNDGGSDITTRVAKIAKKYLLLTMGTEQIVTVEEVATSGTEGQPGYVPAGIKIKGVNGYQQIKKAVLQWFDPEATTVDCCTRNGEYIDLVVGVPVVYTTNANGVVALSDPIKKIDEDGTKVSLDTNEVAITPGLEAFCDYNWIIHNLRMPTNANTNFWAPTRFEMPIVGQVYTQFIIRICKERDGIMGEIVGARGKSVTTHVLYVAGKVGTGGSAAKQVNDVLFGSGAGQLNLSSKKKTDADTKLVAPFS